MTVVNRRWLVTYAVLAVLASPVRAFTQSVLGEPDSRRLPILADKAAVQLLAAQPVYRVRIIYLIPSNRQPQPHAEQTLQRYALRVQTLYRENMARQGYGEKTITFETEPDGIIPKVNVAHVPQTDSQLQNPDYLRRWTNILNALAAAGFPTFQLGEALWVIPEMHEQLPDGTFLESGSFVGGTGTGASGVAVVSSDFLARMPATFLSDNRNYQGLVIPTLGPFPLANGSFPWFEGTTVSSTSSSAQGAGAHELGHAFALPHDFTNDDNFFGNLMGNGLRGVRGFFYPDQYPDSSVALSASSALHLNASAFFNTPTPSGPSPTVFVFSCGTVDGLAGCDFMASSLGGTLAGAVLRRNGSAVASMPLTGGFAATTILTHDYSPGVADNWELVVYDSQSLFSSIRQITFIPGIGPNRAPFPAIRVGKHSVVNGEQVVLDASRSFDPDGSTSQVRVEWDLNGDGTFDTPPSFAKQLSTSFAAPGTYQLTARLTDGLGDSSVSSPIGIRVEPGIVNDLVTLDVINSRFSSDATGCPSEYAGKFFINALLANRSELDLSRMRMGIINLTEGVLMMGTNAVFEEGEFLDPPNVSNQHLASGEAASVAFTLCLEKKESFQFFVNVHALAK
jgi:hypothetical protein